MKYCFIIILSVFLFSSCVRDYQKELREKIALLEKDGKRVIDYSSEKHFIIYKDGISFCFDNLDEPVRTILSAEKEMKLFNYNIEWNNFGKPDIILQNFYGFTEKLGKNYWLDNEKESTSGYVYPFKSSTFDLVKNDSAIYFTYSYNTLDRGGTPTKFTNKYLYSLSKPDVLFSLSYDASYNYINDCIVCTATSSPKTLAEKLTTSYYDTYPYIGIYQNSGVFKWTFEINGQGGINYKSSDILYVNKTYNKEITFNIDDFSSKERALNILQAINDTIKKAQENEYINEINDKAIDISDISDCFHNELKAEKDFIGKRIILKCNIDAIEKADGWLDLNGYKYKIISHSSELFGEWMSGYDIIGYTNDDNFIDLSCPNTIIMECVLISGSVRRFQFKDCKLILAGKK